MEDNTRKEGMGTDVGSGTNAVENAGETVVKTTKSYSVTLMDADYSTPVDSELLASALRLDSTFASARQGLLLRSSYGRKLEEAVRAHQALADTATERNYLGITEAVAKKGSAKASTAIVSEQHRWFDATTALDGVWLDNRSSGEERRNAYTAVGEILSAYEALSLRDTSAFDELVLHGWGVFWFSRIRHMAPYFEEKYDALACSPGTLVGGGAELLKQKNTKDPEVPESSRAVDESATKSSKVGIEASSIPDPEWRNFVFRAGGKDPVAGIFGIVQFCAANDFLVPLEVSTAVLAGMVGGFCPEAWVTVFLAFIETAAHAALDSQLMNAVLDMREWLPAHLVTEVLDAGTILSAVPAGTERTSAESVFAYASSVFRMNYAFPMIPRRNETLDWRQDILQLRPEDMRKRYRNPLVTKSIFSAGDDEGSGMARDGEEDGNHDQHSSTTPPKAGMEVVETDTHLQARPVGDSAYRRWVEFDLPRLLEIFGEQFAAFSASNLLHTRWPVLVYLERVFGLLAEQRVRLVEGRPRNGGDRLSGENHHGDAKAKARRGDTGARGDSLMSQDARRKALRERARQAREENEKLLQRERSDL
ncbi:unnamed protein product [Amoebophrya sp. A25]|nr:unnamed protein product [Amoebophrya sp. A25]|eukprot:GSA25T00013229001.1